MKEFYLVPKRVAEQWKKDASEREKELPERNSSNEQKEMVSNLKIREINRESSREKMKPEIPYNIDPQEPKPSLDSVLTIALKASHLPAAKELMLHIANSPVLSWDNLGNFNPPLDNLNLVEFLKFILSYNMKWTKANNIPDMMLLMKIANIPSSFINNPSAKSILLPKVGGRARVGVANTVKGKQKLNRWLPY